MVVGKQSMSVFRETIVLVVIILLIVVGGRVHIGRAQTIPTATPLPSPTATLSPSPTATPLPTPTFSLEQRISKLEGQIEKPKPKDIWDRLSAVSGIFSALATGSITGLSALTTGLITGFAAYATYTYNKRQQAIEQARNREQRAIERIQLTHNLVQFLFSEEKQDTAPSGAPPIPSTSGSEELLSISQGKKLDVALRAIALIDLEFVVNVAAMLDRERTLYEVESLISLGVLSLEPKLLERARMTLRINRLAQRVGRSPEQVKKNLDEIVKDVKGQALESEGV
ncbi:MAG TPA: hypothetical protein VGD58_11365 [Herpetosiphonaceae bacterium]